MDRYLTRRKIKDRIFVVPNHMDRYLSKRKKVMILNRNKEIEERISKEHLLKWQIASKVGVADTTLSRWLRTELTGSRKERIEWAIRELTKAKEQ